LERGAGEARVACGDAVRIFFTFVWSNLLDNRFVLP
jgi:hypothetical protein